MKLAEAITKMNPNDIFKTTEAEHVDFIMSGGGAIKRVDNGEFIRASKHTLAIVGQIIPVEPKVLSVEDIIKKEFPDYDRGGVSFSWMRLVEYFEKGEKQQWLNHKPLVDGVGKYLTSETIEFHESGIIEAFENLKPLKP